MFGLQTLDVILGLVFTYLVLSLLCTSVNELIAQWLDLRATTLARGIRLLLSGEDEPIDLEDAKTAVNAAEDALQSVRKKLDETDAAKGALAALDAASGDRKTAREAVADAVSAELAARREAEHAESVLATAPADNAVALAEARTALLEARTRTGPSGAALASARAALDAKEAAYDAALASLRGIDASATNALVEAIAASERAEAARYTARLYQHPLIRSLSYAGRMFPGKRRTALPSYIPSRTFALGLLDLIAPSDAGGPDTVAEVRKAALRLPDPLRRPLLILINQTGGDMDRLHREIQRWYENAMERLTGLYKRKAQLIVVIIAFVVTIGTNADTIRIVRDLSNNSALREAVVAHAQALASEPPEQLRRERADSPAQPAAAQATADTTTASLRLKSIYASVDSLKTIGLPIGWGPLPDSIRARLPAPAKLMSITNWPAHAGYYGGRLFHGAFGLLMTVFALSLGAPFWFDMLNKVVNIRAAGRAPEEKPKPPEELPPARGA